MELVYIYYQQNAKPSVPTLAVHHAVSYKSISGKVRNYKLELQIKAYVLRRSLESLRTTKYLRESPCDPTSSKVTSIA